MHELPFHTLDVFTDRVFGGNPLAVVLDADELSGEQMQQVAREFNLSETVFVLAPTAPGAAWRLRIFTPAIELPFAGHPTVGTAVLLADLGLVPVEDRVTTLVLEEEVGPVPVTVTIERGRAVAAQIAAAQEARVWDFDGGVDQIAAVLSLDTDLVGAPGLQPEMASAGVEFLIVPVERPETVSQVEFDTAYWQRHMAAGQAQHFYVFAHTGEGELYARMFGPGMGIAEDPATGAAATALAAYLARARPSGVHTWSITQGVDMGRPSLLHVEAEVAGGAVRAVRVGGAAVRVADGVLRVPTGR